jgi:DNA primase catalytic subunit
MIFDRAFFDFDISHCQAHKLKKKLQSLRCHSLIYEKQEQLELQQKIKNLIVNEKIAEPAINEAKHFSTIFKESFGKPPALFFSGSKGCHAYIFYEPTRFTNINRALTWFGEQIKQVYNYETLDLSVINDAMVRLSRVPYSKHQYSLLSVVPFRVDDSYNEIVERALNPQVESFQVQDYLTNFHSHLKEIDETLSYNRRIESLNRKQTPISPFNVNMGLEIDHREFFKNMMGQPARIYADKEYVMYRCPFPDHEDRNPSFRVHKTGYYCYGCQRKGNYFKFLKDYYRWNDEEVKHYLKIKKNRPPTP